MFKLNKCLLRFNFNKCLFSWKNVEIPIDKIELSFSRSGGAGGQNVNKLNTKVELRFKVDSASWLTEEIKKGIFEKFPNKINNEGELILTSQEHRTQEMNRSEAKKKLQMLIYEASLEKKERIIFPIEESESEEKKRIEGKRMRSQIKRMRRNDVD